jgi:hypothetical protein
MTPATPMRALFGPVVALVTCQTGAETPRETTYPSLVPTLTASAEVPAPESTPELESASAIMARTLCDHTWRFSSASARPYASKELCLEARRIPRPCSADQARRCSTFARELGPGAPGEGLHGDADCRACLAPHPDAPNPLAEQRAALERSVLTVHSVRLPKGAWPAELASQRSSSAILVQLDLSLTGYGYRIDPDDFMLVESAAATTAVADSPFTERLTRNGRPVAWTDPSIVDDPDLRILASFVVSAALAGSSLHVSYDGKISAPFVVR